MHLKVFLKLKNPKNSLIRANIYIKNQKKQKRTINKKNPKKTLGLVKKNPGFFRPTRNSFRGTDSSRLYSLADWYYKKGCLSRPPGWDSIPELTNTGSGVGIRVSPVPLVMDQSGIAQLGRRLHNLHRVLGVP
jgi:hypothetical protein